LGKSLVVRRGLRSSLVIVSYGTLLPEALEAADTLGSSGIDADVINARFAAPIDVELLDLLTAGKRIITVEDHYLSCGFGSALLELAATNGCELGRIRVLGARRRFFSHHSRAAQLMEAGVTADEIVKTAKELVIEREIRSTRRPTGQVTASVDPVRQS